MAEEAPQAPQVPSLAFRDADERQAWAASEAVGTSWCPAVAMVAAVGHRRIAWRDPMGEHLIDGEFQSDKYPTTPRGLFPMKLTDPDAQPLLWLYAELHAPRDAQLSADLKRALLIKGFKAPARGGDGHAHDEWPLAERYAVQLAGCGAAALGAIAPRADEAKPGDYGWSPSYADVVKIRRELEAARALAAAVHKRWNMEEDPPEATKAERLEAELGIHLALQAYEGLVCTCKGLADGSSSYCTIHCCGVAAAPEQGAKP